MQLRAFMSSSAPQMDPEKRREVELLRQKMGVEERKARQWHQQYLENAMVLKELKDVGEDGSIYKMMGGVLVKQEHVEAVSNVQKRIEFIRAEERRCTASIESLQKEASNVISGNA